MSFTFKLRRDTALDWTNRDPVLASGEPGYETDTHKMKIGDGTSRWSALPYFASQSTQLTRGTTVPTENTPGSLYLQIVT